MDSDRPHPDSSSSTSRAPAPESAPLTESQLVTRGLIRRYAMATANLDPIHHDVDAARARGHRDLVAPPFYFCTLGLSLGRTLPRDALREDGLPLSDGTEGRIVMGQTAVCWSGDILAGDEVQVTQTFDGVQTRQGRAGVLELYTYTRRYTVEGVEVVSEELVRVGRR